MKKSFYKRSLQQRRIYLWGPVTEKTAMVSHLRFDHYFTKNAEPINVIIHSPGGCSDSMASIMDDIMQAKQRGITVRTFTMGMALSAGGFILALGSKGHRYVRPLSTVMLHPMSFGMRSDYVEQQERMTAFAKNMDEYYTTIVAKAIGKPRSRVKKDIEQGLWLNAEQAVKYGAADQIWRGSCVT